MEKQNVFSLTMSIMPVNWLALKTAPELSKKLRKLKSRAMVEAIATGSYHKGNHRIEFASEEQADVFSFYYRDTLIAKWSIAKDRSTLAYIHAGMYEGSISTMQQRREIKEAVTSLKEVYAL